MTFSFINQLTSMQYYHSNKTYAEICKKQVGKKAISMSTEHSFNSFKPAPSTTQKLALKMGPSSGSPNLSEKQEEECAKQQKQEQQKLKFTTGGQPPPVAKNIICKL